MRLRNAPIVLAERDFALALANQAPVVADPGIVQNTKITRLNSRAMSSAMISFMIDVLFLLRRFGDSEEFQRARLVFVYLIFRAPHRSSDAFILEFCRRLQYVKDLASSKYFSWYTQILQRNWEYLRHLLRLHFVWCHAGIERCTQATNVDLQEAFHRGST